MRQTLLEKLTELGGTDSYPFHMPGHKRRTGLWITSFPNPYSVDITEIDGFDNLHHPEGILRESMDYAAAVYGADRTYYLVNGSTCGILGVLCGGVRPGSRIIMARNSHKAAYHAVLLNRLDPVYVQPELLEESGIPGGIAPRQVERAILEHQDAAAVFITSPTYEGIVSDIEAIADIAHKYQIPLIVDEAHGAHFSFRNPESPYFPKSALECGADAVIQSLHKTLPALTQTAVLHIKGGLADREGIERYLSVFQSSSPSYVLMSSIENCVCYMAAEGRERLERHGARMERWMDACKRLKHLRLLTDAVKGSRQVKDRDLSKIVVYAECAAGTGLAGEYGLNADSRRFTGIRLAEILRRQYHLEPEMACRGYAILMTSLMDSGEGLERLRKALFEIDGMLDGDYAGNSRECPSKKIGINRELVSGAAESASCPERRLLLCEAAAAGAEAVALAEAAGRVSGGFVTVYPPGIPAVVPGEVFTEAVIRELLRCEAEGLTVEGLTEEYNVRVVKENQGERQEKWEKYSM